MMVHLEGDVVDSIYETFLLSWSTRFRPPLPCMSSPASKVERKEFLFSDRNPYLQGIELTKAAKAARAMLRAENEETQPEEERAHSRLGMCLLPCAFSVSGSSQQLVV
jgi:hypothetical protein